MISGIFASESIFPELAAGKKCLIFKFKKQMYDCIIGVTPESYEKGKQQA